MVTERASAAGITRLATVLFLCLFASQASILVLSPLLLKVSADLEVSAGVTGQLRTITGLVAGVSAFLVPPIGRRIGLHRLLIAGCLVLAGSALASALAPTFWVLAAAQMVAGVGIAVVLTGTVAAAGSWPPRHERKRALSWALAGQPTAWIVGMPLLGVVADVSWRAGWAVFGAGTASMAAAALRTLSIADSADVSNPAPHPRRLQHRPGALPWAARELLAFCAWTGVLVYAGYLFATGGAGSAWVGVALGIGATGYLAGNLAARRLLPRSAARPAAVLAAALAAAVLAFTWLRPSFAVSSVLFTVLAAVAGARTLAGSVRGLEIAGSEPLATMSTRSAANQFGYVGGAGLGGLAILWGGFTLLGIVLAVCAALAAIPDVTRTSRSLIISPWARGMSVESVSQRRCSSAWRFWVSS